MTFEVRILFLGARMIASNPNQPSQHIAAAHALDSTGRHEEAVNVLVTATHAGDISAKSELGHRLLVGRFVPQSPGDGVKLIHEAALGGEPNALERIAALSAGGAFFPQSWKTALQCLGQAALFGSVAAQKQLLALCNGEQHGMSWEQLADSIDVTKWLEVSSGERLSPDGRVMRFPALVPPMVCSWLIERSRNRLQRARVYDSVSGRETMHSMRNNTVAEFDLASVDVIQLLVQARMSIVCGIPWSHMESPTILHYDVGEQISEHFDFVDPGSTNYLQQLREQGQRVVTFLLYLNEDYSGGVTDFPTLEIQNKGTTGEGLFFINAHPDGRPDKDMLHAGRPPTSGEKWIVSQFIRSVPARSIIASS
jgi:prolyl 4-hydroxylase